jgi:hypothetical protein
MQKCISHVQLINGPGARASNAEDNLNRGWLDHYAESLIVVNAVLLGEATN